jgi:NADH-quinone oxidoreductase subunit N
VLGGALALTAVGLALFALATGVTAPSEQWGVLQLGLSRRMVWSVALPLVLLAGVVLLGGAPFHFWLADLFQGAPAAVAPLAVAALQALGAMWLVRELAGLEAFTDGAVLAATLLRIAAAAAFLAGAGTLLAQRRPERRVGTLASLQGALALAALATTAGRGRLEAMVGAWLVPWAAQLALALSGAALLARLTPADAPAGAPGGHLFRRHPGTALIGLYAMGSLAGVPGTPGAMLWLDVARGLASSGHSGLLVALALGWLAALVTVRRELRAGFGAPTGVRPEHAVPLPVRAALWVGGAGLLALGAARLALR